MTQGFEPAPPVPLGRRGTWVVGGLATAVFIAWALAGDACAIRRADSDPEALELLRDTAAAARRTPYQGTQVRTMLTTGGPARTVVKVAHSTGGSPGAATRGTSVAGVAPSTPAAPEAFPAAAVAPGGTLSGFTPGMLALLTRNYAVVRADDGTVCGRRARVVEARRGDGSAAGRFWIDAETGLMLHRELIDDGGTVVSAAGFSELRISAPRIPMSAPSAVAAPWRSLAAAEIGALRERGWRLPRALPGGLSLVNVRLSGPAGGPVHLSYSDGLAAVSVFVQRGRLNVRRLAGWRRTVSAGRPVFRRESRGRWALWAGDGYVYTVLTDAPQVTADGVVSALPHGDTGFWGRLRRGASRIGTWANPWN
ncbi:sigma-E factor regulatory protein RseB domain-containing protein [Thermomonospora umbrina]|uniref:MucB/RseB-like sigma(E) regulatory protein n=1 Tax=Thermomonospora umbrina TaxID=111806 RepID=A0A3D9STL0_9ACTN|nr:sigma-E factor regulatory protein RseB domain-containing protein [Thermomonospora umbrina]REE95904.1 MucB/RseB-like sigma(E) regulatory protein [Thermomonospora umbrina]